MKNCLDVRKTAVRAPFQLTFDKTLKVKIAQQTKKIFKKKFVATYLKQKRYEKRKFRKINISL